MSYDTEFDNEYAIEPEILAWFKDKGFDDASWHNNICPSFTLENPGTRGDLIVEIFVDAQDPREREAGPCPRFSVHWFDEHGDAAECFTFRTFPQVGANFARIMESKS